MKIAIVILFVALCAYGAWVVLPATQTAASIQHSASRLQALDAPLK